MPELKFTFNEQLRSVPEDPQAFADRVAELQTTLAQNLTPLDRVNHLGELAVYLRISGDLERAENSLQEALRLIDVHELGERKRTQQRIRLGHVLQFRKDFAASNQLFAEVLRECQEKKELEPYLAFAWQHSGKNQFDQGNYQEALKNFENAKALRLKNDTPKDQLESTLYAIEVCQRRLDSASIIS